MSACASAGLAAPRTATGLRADWPAPNTVAAVLKGAVRDVDALLPFE
jgi:hypothetical protein